MYYFGNFKYLTDQQNQDERERRHGAFSMMVRASSSQEALKLFRDRLIRFRQSTKMFTGICMVYVSQLLEFEDIPDGEAVLLDLKSFVGDPTLPFISCVAPTEESNACVIHQWDSNEPLTEDHPDTLFLEFKD